MQTIKIKSSLVKTVSHDARKDFMTVGLVNGRKHLYVGVPKAVARQLVTSPSPGKFFNNCVKNDFKSVRLS